MSTCNCPDCYKRRGWEAPRVTDALLSLDGPVPMTESLIDDLVGDLVGALAMLREPQCGGHSITDDQLKDRARNIVQGLIGNYSVARLA